MSISLPDSLSAGGLAALVAAAFVAGCARGFSGFGGALIFVPIASSIIAPRLAVPLFLIVDFVLTPGLIPKAFRNADRSAVSVMLVGAVFGVPLGTYLLTHMDGVTLRWVIVAIVAALLALLTSGWRFRGRPHASLTAAVGVASGLFSGAAQIGGPPVVAYWLGGTSTPLAVRSNIVLYFAISSVISAVSYLIAGILTLEPILLWACSPEHVFSTWLTKLFSAASATRSSRARRLSACRCWTEFSAEQAQSPGQVSRTGWRPILPSPSAI